MEACGILKFSDDFTVFVDPQGVGCFSVWNIECGESIVRVPEETVGRRPLGVAEVSDDLARSIDPLGEGFTSLGVGIVDRGEMAVFLP